MVHNQHMRREHPMMTFLLFDSPSAELPQNLLCDDDMISQRRSNLMANKDSYPSPEQHLSFPPAQTVLLSVGTSNPHIGEVQLP
jgi:hypothetical protein